ncbi:MAG: PKD domain-containing protein [Pseudomonadota bacterium]
MAANQFVLQSEPREVANIRFDGKPLPAFGESAIDAIDPLLQQAPGALLTNVVSGFPGASNNDNGAILGFLIAPPDTDGAVGPNHFVQMINLLTTIYDKNGNEVVASFPSNAIWAGIGGDCEPNNQGDPIVLYDEQQDRWLVSQFAFPDDRSSFAQCVAISQTGDPTAAYNRYEFSFDGIGFNDYPKHGIVTDSITMMANLFTPVGNNFLFAGTYLGVMDKNAMYAGLPATLLGLNIGTGEFGFVAGDLDGPGTAPALFATAMSNFNSFDIWQIDVDWSTESGSVNQIATIPITPFDADLCPAFREACIPQPSGGPSLEAITDRLMHRLQVRDFGAYRTMLATHTVDVGLGRAGVRWYEFRETAGVWSLYQEGTYGPSDGENRWMPSIAMNADGDIGLGYLLASNNTFVSTAVTGQSASNSGTGVLDGTESLCAVGTGVQFGTGRSGDYSTTSIDPTDESFWHTNEVFVNTGQFQWSTFVCNFTVTDPGGNTPPNAAFSSDCTDLTCDFTDSSSDSDGTVVAWDWDFGDGTTSTLQNPSHTYLTGGDFTVTLTVTDDGGDTGSATQSVSVSDPANLPPTAAFSDSCTDLTCDFTDASTDGDGTIAAWSWIFGDGAVSTEQSPTHTYASAGTFDVTLTVTDDDGDSDSVTQSVTVSEPPNALPTAAFGDSCTDLTCDFTDASSDSDGTIAAWSWAFGDGATSTEQSPTHSYASAGSFDVTLTVTDDDGDSDTVTQSVTVSEPANIAPTAAFSESCTDLTCDFTDASSDSDGTIASWSWAFGDGTTSTAQNPSYTYAASGTYSVTLTVTDDDGDSDSVTQSVTVSEPPNVAPTASFSDSCTDLTCSFTDASTDSDGSIASWSWAFGDGATSVAQSPSHTYAASGTYNVTLTVTDDDGDSDSVTQSVTVSDEPGEPISAAFSSDCNNFVCQFTDQSSDGTGTIVAWSWSFGDGVTSSMQNPFHGYRDQSVSTRSVTLTVTNDQGDSDTVTQSVNVSGSANTPPTAAFSESCTELTCNFTDGSSDSDGTLVAWSWTFGDGAASSAQNPSHTYAAAGTYSVTLTVIDNGGGSDSVTQSVTVAEPPNAPPTAAFSESCTDLSCDFSDASSDSDGTIASWSWAFGDGATSTAQNPSHTYAAAGTYSVTLTVTDDDGDSGSVTQSVTVAEPPNAPPMAAFSDSCTDLSCDFTDASSDSDGTIASWSWAFGDGATSTAQNPSHTYAAAGTYSVTLTVTDDDGDSDSVTQSVTVAGPPNVAPTAAFTDSCAVLTCDFTDGSTDSDGTIVAWSWSFGDGALSTEQNPTHVYASAGSFDVTLTVTDDGGDSDSITQSVTVTEPPNDPPTAAFSDSCADLTCDFSDSSSDTDGTIAAWSWAFGDGATSTAQNPSHTYAAAGTYSVTLTVTDNDGDSDSVTQSVTVAEPPNLPPTAAFSDNCTDLACNFTDGSSDSDGTIAAWSWAFGDGATSTAQNPSHTYAAAGTYSVTLTVTDNDGDSDSVTQSVTVSEPPNAPPSAAFSDSCSDLDCAFTDASSDGDGSIVAWSWSFGDGATSNAQSPSHTYASAGTYSVTLTVTDDDGDSDSVTQSVTVTEAGSGAAPTASFNVFCRSSFCFFVDQSTDSDGSIVSWSWDFGDGTSSTQQNPFKVYGSSGTFAVTLTVTDNDGNTNSTTQDVTLP